MIQVDGLGKCFHLFDSPGKRFLQALFGKRFSFHREFWALRDVSLQVSAGEVVGIIGRNGSGKSTLLQIIAGTLRASRGKAQVHGRVAALLELGMGFDPEHSGRDNVIFNAMLLGMSREEIAGKLEEIIAFADIGPFIDQPVKTYSSGMYVRLAFALNAHVDADLLIVDEALAVGDAAFQFKCLSRLDELLARGVTILLVSHDAQLIKGYCSRAIYLRDGQVAFDGDCETACELYQRDSQAGAAVDRVGERGTDLALGNGGLAFGNAKGRIQQLRLGTAGEWRESFDSGERIVVEVVARLFQPVSRPRITLVLRDLRGYNLYAFNNSHQGIELPTGDDGLLHVRISFAGDLQAGDYALTVRLDDALTDELCELLDKQVNAATFRINNPIKRFDAVVNLHGSFELLHAP
ncbi:lipopolysaccharide transport system ATP-binding protein [Pseudomonas delhiensis]|uniref:Lipopolysaccharide transport system ATP-binding protein n=1 Tax=Pseudomonas delhiensis TaxID=366289 RepID=A0A239MNW1_9PSED|nr:ABC transporter ATP-binding protein [Pseudomonas delhiensis]SDH99818.1 lipopolysaccharide transport system ATP-binding protein [Pseudomonas delhiensis]SNT44426.1 lipopolysaccharide transport system ATP-binding protein [Pseudomonas delhiensis]